MKQRSELWRHVCLTSNAPDHFEFWLLGCPVFGGGVATNESEQGVFKSNAKTGLMRMLKDPFMYNLPIEKGVYT